MKSETSDLDFEQLVRRTLADVAETTPVDALTNPSVGRQSTKRSMWLGAAAAVLVVAGLGGLVVAQRQTSTPAVAQFSSPIDPVAHLFVLPDDTEGLVLTGGGAYTARPDPTDGTVQDWVGYLMGTKLSDGSFSNLAQVVTLDAIPDGFGAEGTTDIDTPTGPATVDDSFGYRLLQQRGDVWLLLTARNGSPRLVDALAQVQIGPTGELILGDGPMTIVEEFDRSSTTVDYSTYYEMTDASGTVFVVETATTSSVVALGATTFETISPTSVNGTPAWLATREGDPPEGINAAVVWRATPNRIIAISAHAHPEVVKAMAETLQAVSIETWSTALPGALIED